MEIHGWSEFSHIQDKINQLFKENWKSSTSTLKTRNVTDYDRDLLFVWNPKDSNIFVINFTLVAGVQTNGANYHQVKIRALFYYSPIFLNRYYSLQVN
jgi:hypothetical protein